jgi:hypothetical protein
MVPKIRERRSERRQGTQTRYGGSLDRLEADLLQEKGKISVSLMSGWNIALPG